MTTVNTSYNDKLTTINLDNDKVDSLIQDLHQDLSANDFHFWYNNGNLHAQAMSPQAREQAMTLNFTIQLVELI